MPSIAALADPTADWNVHRPDSTEVIGSQIVFGTAGEPGVGGRFCPPNVASDDLDGFAS